MLNFPSSPTLNQAFTSGTKRWVWDGTSWVSANYVQWSSITGAPTALSSFTNDSGYITSSALSPYLTSATAASTYQTQAGMSSYLSAAAAASTYLAITGGTLTGNLGFSGTGLRITGDFSNATSTSRVLVQTSTTDGNTLFGLLPNGTATNSQFHVWGASDPTNAPFGALTINATAVQLQSTAAGSGTGLPLRFLVGSTEAYRIDTSARMLVGFSTNQSGDKLQVSGLVWSSQGFTSYGTAGNVFTANANGIGSISAIFQNTGGNLYIGRDSSTGGTFGYANAHVLFGTGANPLVFHINAADRGRITSGGNWLIGTATDDGVNKLQVSGGFSADGNLTLVGTARRILGDFTSNATIGNRVMFQTSTANGNSLVSVIPNGTATQARWIAYNLSDPTNANAAALSALNTDIRLASVTNGTATALPMTFYMGTTEAGRVDTSARWGIGQTSPVARLDVNGNQAINIVTPAALDIDCSAGNFFTKTISANSTFTFSNAPSSRAFAFTLELVHTSGTVTWPASVVWPGGTAPTLTTGKTHLFAFVTDNNGTTWRGVSNINYSS